MLPQKLTDRAFWRSESAAAGAMLIAAAAGLAAANSPLASAYTDLVVFKLAGQTLLAWVNEGLMVWFFLLVGLEIRREIAARGLATMRAPLVAAAGGMLVPALMYLAAVGGDARWARGWAIPAATDIAFALAALRAVGASAEAKRLLVSLAIFDDMGAVLVIALFYAKKLILWRLVAAAACLGAIGWLARRGARQSWIYALFGALAWAAMLHSGVHATTIGVLIAFLIPRAVAERWERALLGWVNWAVLPVFALANAGVPFVHLGSEAWLHPVPVAVMLGLVAGKPLGVLAGLWVVRRLGWLRAEDAPRKGEALGLGWVCGVGFTMSLFIGELAFEDALSEDLVFDERLGILGGSLMSAIAGMAWMKLAAKGGVRV